jgi:myo-inositol 2-dehydrogenase/D-chiro-inositol 1-dehydrogenase
MNFFLERYMPSYHAEMAAFADAVLDGTPVPATGDDGLRALVLAEAAARSHAERRTVDVSEV